MDNKYFTPSIHDIKVGYECERIIPDFSRNFDIFLHEEATQKQYDEVWDWYYNSDKIKSEKYILTNKDIIDLLKFTGDLREGEGLPIRGFFRTPYLTKEQVEEEGWIYKGYISKKDGTFPIFEYIKEETKYYSFSINHYHYCTIYSWSTKEGTKTLYRGYCKDINIFRHLPKLLNIK